MPRRRARVAGLLALAPVAGAVGGTVVGGVVGKKREREVRYFKRLTPVIERTT